MHERNRWSAEGAKTFEELKILRSSESHRIIKDLKKLLQNEYVKSREQSQKKKSHTLHRQTNNKAERTIRHAGLGLKNYYGSGSYSGAETAATLFTMIEFCKKK